jgi:hypothetical protein
MSLDIEQNIMSKYHFSALIFLLASIATPAVCADEFTQLGLSVFGGGKTCDLKEVRPDSSNSYQGKRSFDICTVKIPAKEFNKEYEFCYLSGVETTRPNEMDGFKCRVSYGDTGWTFAALIELSSSVKDKYHNTIGCSYICKNKR